MAAPHRHGLVLRILPAAVVIRVEAVGRVGGASNLEVPLNGKTAKFIGRVSASFLAGRPERNPSHWKHLWRKANAKERTHLRITWAHERGVRA
jgi:hypothetical protein